MDQYPTGFVITSGYRSKALCKALGSKTTSQHAKGEAVDFEVMGIDNYDVACWVRDNLEFDQLILEHYTKGDPDSGWIHCSYKTCGHNRKQVLVFDGKRYTEGLAK